MKKKCFVLLCAALLALAPSAFAADSSALSLDGLLARLMAILSGLDNSDDEMGWQIEPFGQTVESPRGAEPPNNSAATPGEAPEMGSLIEPFG